jgi:hypothetical protein
MPSTRKNAIEVHQQIWEQCLGVLKGVEPGKMEETIEDGFDPPFQLFATDPALSSASASEKVDKILEVDIKRKLMTYVNASLARQQVIALFSTLFGKEW